MRAFTIGASAGRVIRVEASMLTPILIGLARRPTDRTQPGESRELVHGRIAFQARNNVPDSSANGPRLPD